MGTEAGTGGAAATGRAGADVWEMLTAAAGEALAGAYAPYSRYPVGAAALTESGAVLTGANVENASYGLTLCAECAIVSQAGSRRHGRLVAVVCVEARREPITPCGRCRQLLAEHATDGCEVLTEAGAVPLSALLPMAFGPQDLEAGRA